jgi:hypothetical protein
LLEDLARLHYSLREYAESEMLYSRAVSALEKSMGPEHSMVASSLTGHASALRKLKRKKEAAGLEQRAQTILQSQSHHQGPLMVDMRDLPGR